MADRRIIKFSPEVTLGHILTMVAIIIPGIIWGIRLEGRVDAQATVAALQQENVDLRIKQVTADVERNRQERLESLSSIGDSLKEISLSIRQIEVKMENKADRK